MHKENTSPNANAALPASVEVAIVGSGFAGLCMAIQLQKAGINDFVILEKDAVFGGTWRVNHYPGAACDVPSHLYSFSFAQNAHWSRRFPAQKELLAYTESLVRDFGLQPHLHLSAGLGSASYDAASGSWTVNTAKGSLRAKSLVLATGPLSRPALPQLPGLDKFEGKVFHSALWEHDYDLTGKRVAVIGTGASAVQFVPEIAAKTAQLDVYQRTAPWILPRPDRAITGLEKWLLQHVRPLQLLYRAMNYLAFESRFLGFAKFRAVMRMAEKVALAHIRRQIPNDPELRKKVTPSYAMGCKRILLMSDYYPTLARANVELLTGGVKEVRAHGVVGADGVERAADTIIFGTGFDVEHALGGIDIRGRDGKLLADVAEGGLEAYKGAAIPGFPNLFMITGPNTGLGHNSMIYMIESGVRYVVGAVRHLREASLRSVEVKAEINRAYNEDIQRRLQGTVWNSGCKSWYLAANGKNNTLWPGFSFQYRRATRSFDAVNYRAEA